MQVRIDNKDIYLKRDDLLDYGIVGFNGNKARKFLSLLERDFDTLISFGGNQSNAMQVLSALTQARGKRFVYITPSPSTFLAQNPVGNFAFGLSNGVKFVFAPAGSRVGELECIAYNEYENQKAPKVYFIPQGGSLELAYMGMYALAQELQSEYQRDSLIFYTAGSGTSVQSLHKAQIALRHKAEIIPIFCAGEVPCMYGFKRFLRTKFAFGSLHKEIYAMYYNLLAQGIEFDLLYDCVGFCAIESALKSGYFSHKDLAKQWVFVHSGGLFGNQSQLMRYKRKFPCFNSTLL